MSEPQNFQEIIEKNGKKFTTIGFLVLIAIVLLFLTTLFWVPINGKSFFEFLFQDAGSTIH